MKKILTVLGLLFIAKVSLAVVPTLSKNNLRIDNDNSSLSFTVSLDDNINKLSGSGNLVARVKLKSKLLTLSSRKISIPYTNGIIGNSDLVTLSIKDGRNISRSSRAKLMVVFPKKYKKKYKIKNKKFTVNLDADAVQISGKVTIPTGNVESFRSRSQRKIRNRNLRARNAENPDGVVVDLVQIDTATGQTVSEPLASAVTDEDGEFEMPMPPGADFNSEYAVIVEGEEAGEDMHCPLFGDEVDINPGTEAIFELIQEAIEDPTKIGLGALDEISFGNFTDVEAEGLDEQMQDLNPLYEDTLEESIANLKDSYEDFLNNMIGVAADDDTSTETNDLEVVAQGIAGDYSVVFFDTRITSNERVDISTNLTSGRMYKPDEVGAMVVKPGRGFYTNASAFSYNDYGDDEDDSRLGQNRLSLNLRNDDGNDDQGPGCYEVEADSGIESAGRNTDEQGNFYMTVDANRVISFAEPAFEETFDNPDGTYIYRSLPSVMNMIPVGDNMFLSSSQDTGYNISPQGDTEYEYTVGFGSIIKKSDIAVGDISGDYGLVGLGYSVESSSFGAITFLGDVNFDNTNVTYNLSQTFINMTNIGCGSETGSSYYVDVNDEVIQGTASLNFKKDRVIIQLDDQEPGSSVLFTGFSTADTEILTMAYAGDYGVRGARGGRKVISEAERQMIFAVKKPISQLDLSSKSYRILSLNFAFNDQGGRTIESGDLGTLSFDSSSQLSITDFNKTSFDKATASSDSVTTSTVEFSGAGIAYTLSETGAISFVAGNDQINGYVSSDARLIILNSDNEESLGMYLAVLQE